MKLFAVQGVANSGKSSALIKLCELIRNRYPSAGFHNYRPRGRDIKVILTLENDMKIGIESQGDLAQGLEESLKLFKKEKCDYIYVTCRTRGETVARVNSMSLPYKILFIPKGREPDSDNHKNVDNKMAHTLLKFLRR